MAAVSITDQLTCARAVLEQMRAKQSRWTEAQEAIVATLERQLMLEEITREIVGRETKLDRIAPLKANGR